MGGEDYLFCIVFIFGGGTFFFHNLTRLGLPYTVVMFLYGMLMGTIGLLLPDKYGGLFDSLAAIEPELIFHIFLPVLIFEGSYGMKIHAFRQVFDKVLLLAGPGLIINTIAIAAALKFIMYPDWSWYLTILVGSLLSATDPVAVVALLKDLGVDKRVTATVDGEAIMNDGTAIIVFTLFLPAAVSGSLPGTWDSILLQCLQLTLGAVIYGLFMGFVTEFFILKSHGNDLVQTCVTVSMAYVTFYTADIFLQTSGVLTLCFMGVYLSSNVPSMFPGKEGSMMNSTWHFIVHLANTLLFSLVGIIIVRDALPEITFLDVVFILLLYVVACLARLGMIMMLRPMLNIRQAYYIGYSEVFLLVHGGLRGGVAVTLALIVANEEGIPRQAQIAILLLTCGIVILTLVVNATTSQMVVSKLGHRRKEMNRIVQMEIGMKHIGAATEKSVRHAKLRSFFRHVNWTKINDSLHFHNPYHGMRAVEENEKIMFNTVVVRSFKTAVWNLRDNDHISENVVRVLTTCCHKALFKGRLISTEDLRPHMQYPELVNVLGRTFGPNSFVGNYVANKRISYDQDFFGILLGYSQALSHMEQICETYSMTSDDMESAERWLSQERSRIELKIERFSESRPNAACAVMTKIAAETILQEVRDSAHELHHSRGFAIPATEVLVHSVEQNRDAIMEWPPEMQETTREELISGCGLLRDLGPSSHTSLNSIVHTVEYRAHDKLTLSGQVGIIMRGVVGAYGSTEREFGAGDVINIAPVLSGDTESKYFSFGPSTILQIPYADLRRVLESDKILEARVWELIAQESLVPLVGRALAPYRDWSYDDILNMIIPGRVVIADHDDFCPIAAQNKHFVDQNEVINSAAVVSEIVCCLSGEDVSGGITSEMRPLVLPLSLKGKLKWRKGSVLFIFHPKLDADTLSDGAKKRIIQRMMGDNPLTLEEMGAVANIEMTQREFDISGPGASLNSGASSPTRSQLLGPVLSGSRGSHRKGMGIHAAAGQLVAASSMLSQVFSSADFGSAEGGEVERALMIFTQYDPKRGLTRIPYFNQLQLEFLVQFEQLVAAAMEFERFPDRPDSRRDICSTITQTLDYLQEFSVSYFSCELELYRSVQEVALGNQGNPKSTLDRFVTGEGAIFSENRVKDHIFAHEMFMKHVSIWRERFFDDDINCYREMLLGMANFTQHFSRDQDMCDVVVLVFAATRGFCNRRFMPPLEYVPTRGALDADEDDHADGR